MDMWTCGICEAQNLGTLYKCSRCLSPKPPPSNKFWMVLGEGSRAQTPSVKHPTLALAKAEASRLCEKERHPFWVLECVGRAELRNVEYTEVA